MMFWICALVGLGILAGLALFWRARLRAARRKMLREIEDMALSRQKEEGLTQSEIARRAKRSDTATELAKLRGDPPVFLT